jgi:hypothetical protein
MVANLNTAVICHVILTHENVGTVLHYRGIFITLAPGIKLAALACHPTKKVSKAEELTYLSTILGSEI